MDDSRFGGLDALTNGFIARYNNEISNNLFNVKTNGEMRSHMFDVAYALRAPSGFYGVSGRKTFSGREKHGVTKRLKAIKGDELIALIQDDLTGLATFTLIGQGHVVEH